MSDRPPIEYRGVAIDFDDVTKDEVWILLDHVLRRLSVTVDSAQVIESQMHNLREAIDEDRLTVPHSSGG